MSRFIFFYVNDLSSVKTIVEKVKFLNKECEIRANDVCCQQMDMA